MKRGRLTFWDIIAWAVLAGIFIWLILKVSGIINTPELIEYAPIFGAVYLVGWAMHKLDTASDDIKELKHFSKETVNKINSIKTKCIKNHGN
ncbi:MAG: hypothetical protein NTU63_04030 [Candidatus Pacearchaeota archaeon]|nr:hypothetical protein [Candidatus Pacearchaeota archaeon]